ncbi:hypothetical protein [Bradyrhizobium sp. DOA9]|uniref:hypothetical protein n=1 Tax=Bradyrhizobium sp. DOA9 TaxID=1126627 RepID=UPI00046A5D27|nr:hypothetical protein [Bradyrhizobium sp. DOA9]GAJ35150.1 hypothetical protein BDOA9_0143490 [Bradyrhizobium sp. DOA9]
MSLNFDLPKHASDKVQRALEDVLQLTADPGERLRIYLLASGICIGGAGGALAAIAQRDRKTISELEAKLVIIDLVRRLIADGPDAAWKFLEGDQP